MAGVAPGGAHCFRKMVLKKIRQIVWKYLPRRLRAAWELRKTLRALEPLRRPVPSRDHGLAGDLIISLTSYPPRFGNLHLTLESLLNQTVKADRVILWVAESDMNRLSRRTLQLKERGLDIRAVPDVRSYKKLVFALEAFPEAYFVTADDDVFYRPDWLATLVEDSRPGLIICRRAHRIPSFHEKRMPPYLTWERLVEDEGARVPCADIVPTGVGGILYPPASLHSDVTNAAIFMDLCPRADDLWFYMMARKAGSLYQKVGGPFEQISWPGTQEVALYHENLVANDEQMARLVAYYGHPAEPAEDREGPVADVARQQEPR